MFYKHLGHYDVYEISYLQCDVPSTDDSVEVDWTS